MAGSSRSSQSQPGAPASGPFRFAHPYYTTQLPDRRQAQGPFGQRAIDWSRQQVGPIPDVRGKSVMALSDVIGEEGAQAVATSGAIRFHAVGDTGRPGGVNEVQQQVADDMTLDYHPDAGANNPAFFLHLGDVVYGPNKSGEYLDEFYRPYMHYPGKIIAIPGNHDGEVLPGTDPDALKAFTDNFCLAAPTVPAIAQSVGILRQMVAQPGAYWRLNAPFLDIIGLYSNSVENPGYLDCSGPNPNKQKEWLLQTLQDINAERAGAGAPKALIVVTHHPPYSGGGRGSHSGSQQMLDDIDAACQQAGVIYDAVLSGHSHNYQRYTRRLTFGGAQRAIPFVVAGGGGHGLGGVQEAYGQPEGDHTYDKSLSDYGYLLVTVSQAQLTIAMWQVSAGWQTPSASDTAFDTVTVDLATHTVS